ncbi:MAG: hypothetical protein ACMUHM_00425 [Thermoplasmatota archaeon]
MSMKVSDPSIRRPLVSIAVLLLLALSVHFEPGGISPVLTTDAALTSIDPIVIEGNAGLASHPTIRSGDGSTLNPYIISDYSIDSYSTGRYGIAIRNTTAHLIVQNITIRVADASIGIYLRAYGSYSMNIVLKNITITGGSTQVYLYVPIRVSITDCTFNNPSISGNAIYSYYGYELFITNNTFNTPNMDVDLDYSAPVAFNLNEGTIRRYDHLRFRYSNFANNSLSLYSATYTSGYSSDLQGNELTSRTGSENLVTILDCNRIKIANNTLQGGYHSIYVEHPNTNSPVYTNYPRAASLLFEFNNIEGSVYDGINFYYTTNHAAMTYFNILNNRFTNCTRYAIYLSGGGSFTSVVWRNVFENNDGSGDTYSISSVQVFDRYGQFSWDNGYIGNYWKDKRTPDDDSDGFVDEGFYSVGGTSSRKDNHPVSNPYFDFEKPYLRILTPSGRFVPNSYVNFTWEASDDLSGMHKMEVKNGLQPWVDATRWGHFGLFLVQGNYKIKVRATDRALLKNEIELEIFVNRTVLPFSISSPQTDRFYNNTVIPCTWSTIDTFIPLNITYSLDNGPYVVEDTGGPFDIEASEGEHILKVIFYDHYGNAIERSISFTVDTSEPLVDILYPAEGSVISNELVNFQWDRSDNFGVSATFVRIDGGDLIEKSTNYFSEILATGSHTLDVLVFDQAGNRGQDSINFVISKNTSLNIVSPRLTRPTSNGRLSVVWEYVVANLRIDSLELLIDNQPAIVLDTSATSHEITLTSDGVHRISVEAKDPVKNLISDTVEVVLDKTAPVPDFQFPSDGAYLNHTNIDLQWNAIEKWGLDHYELYTDGILKAGGIKQGSYSLDLSPGKHVLKIKAFDQAGNVGEREISVTIDMSAPNLELIEPAGTVFTEPYVTFRWSGEDDHEIDHYNFTMDQKPVEELGLATSRQMQLSEGYHLFILRCSDLAGNTKTILKEFLVDLNDPEVSFKNPPGDFVKIFNGLIEWEITEANGVEEITLTIDGIDYEVSPTSRYFIFDMETGRHSVSIVVSDPSGRSASADFVFTIDPDPPLISKSETDIRVRGNRIEIFWTLGEGEENLTKALYLDGRQVNIDFGLSEGSFVFAELEIGNHSITLEVQDRAGNSKTLEWDFQVKRSDSSEAGSTSSIGVLIAVLLLFIVLAALGAFYFVYWRKRPKEEKRTLKAPGRPEKLTFAPRPHVPVSAPHQPRVQHHSRPGSTAGRSSHGQHGYIRPEPARITEVKRTIIDAPPVGTKETRERSMHTSPKTEKTSEGTAGKQDDVEDWGEVEDWDHADEVEEWEDMEEL